MATAPLYKLTGRLAVPSVATLWVQYHEDGSPPSPWEAIDLSAEAASAGKLGFYVLSDGSADDMLKWLSDLISAVLENAGADSDTYDLALNNTTGIVTGSYDDSPGNVMRLAFTDPAAISDEVSYWVRDWLRMDSTEALDQISIDSGSSVVGFRTHAFGLFPVKIQLKDADRYVEIQSQAIPDEGGPFTLSITQRLEHVLGVWLFDALPRGDAWNENHQFKDMLMFAANGWPVRYYPNKSLTSPWVEVTNPYGYQVWVVDKASCTWQPAPKERNFLSRQQHELLLHYTSEA